MACADIGVIGLAVMGENLVLNMAGHGFRVAVYNRTTSKVDDFIDGLANAGRGASGNQGSNGNQIVGAHSLKELCAKIRKPRRIMLMVKAGAAVDGVIGSLIPHLQPGDIVIDGGNSDYRDSDRRSAELANKDLLFVGTGVSGGEEGALRGPSIMPGGHRDAWPAVKPIFQAIAAKTNNGEPCCGWVGAGGAGHFVKMVHNGIEYADMQMICEAYHVMKDGLRMSNDEMHAVLARWNNGVLKSYLIEITRNILAFRDAEGKATLDLILDKAAQKGTGKWTAAAALDAGQPLSLIGEAVFARFLSALKDERAEAGKTLAGPNPGAGNANDRDTLLNDLELALYASKIVSYAQGFQLMRAVSRDRKWDLDPGAIALMWRGGCIIRSAFLGNIRDAFERNPNLPNLLVDPFFSAATANAQTSWRRVVSTAATIGIPLPCIGAALAYYDGYRTERLPANLLQAQRDYFGAHTYERVDRPPGEAWHTNWTGG